MSRLIIGDCRTVMRDLIAEGMKVQMCVTSPPYWGLRDYGVAGQLGLEQTMEEYVANMVDVFRLVRELLADDGTLWLNLGDSYAGSGRGGHVSNTSTLEGSIEHEQECRKARGSQLAPGLHTAVAASGAIGRAWVPPPAGLKRKDLCGMPWRVAFALQADGWYLRQDIIWAKPNPMPESVRDRCTKAHEYLFLLAKRECYLYGNLKRKPASARGVPVDTDGQSAGAVAGSVPWEGSTRNKRSVWTVPTAPYAEAHFAAFPPALIEPCILAGSRPGDVVFDPFMGSGTTGEVAQRLWRNWLGIELNPEYGKLIEKRTQQLGLELW